MLMLVRHIEKKTKEITCSHKDNYYKQYFYCVYIFIYRV